MRKTSAYLDNCCLNRPFDEQSSVEVRTETRAKMFIQSLIKYGDISMVYSYVTVYENSRNTFRYKREQIEEFLKHAVKYIDGTQPEILPVAESVMRTGVKARDALHVACAITGGCDYFISVDKRLLKYKSDKIILIDPAGFVSQWEENNG